MNDNRRKTIAASELVTLFAELGAKQDRATLEGDTRAFNALYDEVERVPRELKQRLGDERAKLAALYRHPVMQVRLNAAMATLLVAPDAARKVLETIRASGVYPPAANAAMILDGLTDGTFVPT